MNFKKRFKKFLIIFLSKTMTTNEAVEQEEINDQKYREVVTFRRQLLMSNDKLDILKAVSLDLLMIL